MNAQRYTFVTVVFEDEYELLALQARSMRLYCPPQLFNSIIVIDNSQEPISSPAKGRLIDEYGDLKDSVTLVPAQDVVKLPRANGWVTQQILKLAAAHFIHTERYVVLDAKNHFVRELEREFLEAPDGRARTKMGDYKFHPLRQELVRILSYFALRPDSYLDAFPPTAPPFVMYTEVVRKLMRQVAEHEKMPFEKAFVELRFVEFFLYMGYILHSYGNLSDLYDFHYVSCPIIWERNADEQGCIEAITRATKQQSPVFALHRTAITKLSKRSRDSIADFWYRCGLFVSKESADFFILDFRRRYMLSLLQTWHRRKFSAPSVRN